MGLLVCQYHAQAACGNVIDEPAKLRMAPPRLLMDREDWERFPFLIETLGSGSGWLRKSFLIHTLLQTSLKEARYRALRTGA